MAELRNIRLCCYTVAFCEAASVCTLIMDVNDIISASPLRGLLSSPARRSTPAVPVPDWRNEPHITAAADQAEAPSNIPSVIQHNFKHEINAGAVPASSSAQEQSQSQSLESSQESAKVGSQTTPVIQFTSGRTPASRPQAPHTPHSRVSGEVALTPSNSAATPAQPSNPHAAMAALTPMASGPAQAKNSIKLQNCVSTVSLGCELQLLNIYCRTRFSEYNPSRFHGVVMKILEPRATALVFRSGKIVCTGTRNEHDSYIATRKFARIIQKLGFPAKFLDFKIQNFIATADLRFPVRLEALQQAHGQFTSYEPELFPGLVYRMVRPRIVLLIFVNGKIVFTGGKTRNDISEALEIIYPILHSYRKN